MNLYKSLIPLSLVCFMACKTVNVQPKQPYKIGAFTIQELQKEKWMKAEFANYSPESSTTDSISKYNAYKIAIIGGEWCSDTRTQVPRFIKILKKINFSTLNLTLFMVDKNKECLGCESFLKEKYAIKRVPTFIIYDYSEKEIGRIVETPIRSLEGDLLKILESQSHQ